MKRGSVQKKRSKFIGLWIPDDIVGALDDYIGKIDSDRSKFVRLAIKEKLAKQHAQ